MQISLLGETTDDRGAQLERITARLLSRLGYLRVHTNSIGAGGHEIDVRATFPMPSLSNSTEVAVICECKAHSRVIDTSDWLKFLGKIYTEQASRQRDVRGIMLALTGVNGNVAGAHESIRDAGKPVELVTGRELADLVTREWELCSFESVTAFIRSQTEDAPVDVRLVFHENPRWLVQFADGSFVFVSGTSASIEPPSKAVDLAISALSVVRYRDLAAERLAKERALLAKKTLLAMCIAESGGVSPEQLAAREALLEPKRQQIPISEYESAGAELAADGLVTRANDGRWHASLASSPELTITGLLLLTEKYGMAIPVGTAAYEGMIDEILLQHIIRVQGDVPLPATAYNEALTLLRWSPKALAWALRPDPMLTRSSTPQPADARLGSNHVTYFKLQLLRRAAADFQESGLFEPYFERLRLAGC
jgi:hypothetical protein